MVDIMNKYIILNSIQDLELIYLKLDYKFRKDIDSIIEEIDSSDGYYDGDKYDVRLHYNISEKMILVFQKNHIFYRRYNYRNDYDDWNDYKFYNIQKLLRKQKIKKLFI